MDKKIIILAVLAGMGGVALGLFRSPERKNARGQDLFPPEKLRGYVEHTQISVKEDGKGGRPVLAVAVTPFGIKPEQVSPTGYGALKALHRSFPKADWVSVFIAEDSAMAEASNWVGVAELRGGKVMVTGGIPTQAQIDSLGKLGRPFKRPTQADLKAVAAVFDSTGSLSSERWDLSQNLLGAGTGRIDKSHFFSLDMETNALHAAAKAQGLDPDQLQALVQGVILFYWSKAGDPL
ncbi:MAG TPA: hypothetical protein VJ385_08735 [Fibrobacteria bacterium]|nr:hypothetical protein [Fibrobacteria bacterium]